MQRLDDSSTQGFSTKQSRLRRRWSLCMMAALAPTSAHALDSYEGLAYGKSDNKLAYREVHWRYEQDGKPARLVLYRCPNGLAFARKRLGYSAAAIAPEFDFVDGRDGYREGLRAATGGHEVYWQSNANTAARRRTITLRTGSVVDAGFDALVHARWPQLVSGQSVSADFLLPSRLDFINVSVRRLPASPQAYPGSLRLRMQLDSWYGFVAPRTDLTYRSADRWLLRFEGIGTIRDSRGNHQHVRIEFPPRLHRTSLDRAELADALATPLAKSCRG